MRKTEIFDYPPISSAIASKVLDTVDAGLVNGLGHPVPGKMCVEAAVAFAMGEEHTDQPNCVDIQLCSFKIGLNDDGYWNSIEDRAKGLRRVAIAQLGSKGKLNWKRFHADLKAILFKEFNKGTVDRAQELAKRLAKAKNWGAIDNINGEIAGLLGGGWWEPVSRKTLNGNVSVDHLINIVEGSRGCDKGEATHIAAELVVRCLKKQRIPGTKFLYLTEGKTKPVKRGKLPRKARKKR